MLVSVIIASYNSSQYIEETLNSVKSQSWPELELIITDDHSTDNTTKLCQGWLIENKHHFVNTQLLYAEKNTGVSANLNRGLHVAKSEWIKFLAADDALKPNCIKDNMSWIACHPQTKVLFSRIEVYKNTFKPQNLIDTIPNAADHPKSILHESRSVDSQYKMLLLSDRINFTPSAFLNRQTLMSVKGYDERFKLIEDYPLWLKLTKSGHKLYFMNKTTVNYRRHSKAINNTDINYLIKPNYFRTENFRKIYTYPYLPIDIRLNQRFQWFVKQIFRWDYLNRNKKINRFLLDFITTCINPFKYYIWLKKRFNKKLQNNEFYI